MVGDPVSLTPYQKQMLAVGPQLGAYLPLDALYGGGDLSAPPQHNGEASGGISLGGLAGPIGRDGRNGTTFDGVNDQVLTNWQTRANLTRGPTAEGIAAWGKPSSTELAAGPGPGRISGRLPFRLTRIGAGTGTVTMWGPNITVTPGDKLTISAYKHGGSGTLRVGIDWKKSGVYVSSSASATEDASGRAAVIGQTAPAEANEATPVVDGLSLAEGASIDVDAALIEEGSTLGTYFPTARQLEVGEAGWEGTVGKAVSMIGPLANGTTRTFCAWIKPSGATTRGLWGRSTQDALWLATTGAVRWRANGTDETWTATPTSGAWNFLLHVFDTVNDLSTLYLNGVSQGSQANANPYSFQPGTAQLVLGQALGAFYSGGMAHFALMYGDQSAMAEPLWRAGSGL